MRYKTTFRHFVAPMLALIIGTNAHAFPENLKDLKQPVTNEALFNLVNEVQKQDHISVSVEGKSVQGNPLYLLRFHHSPKPKWRLFFHAQQHGNETSGKDALTYLIKELAQDKSLLPEDVDLYIMPLVNPDGAATYSRRNAAGADLNRDHILLLQPETQALHRVGRRIMPHIVVDGHEFKRDTGDYLDKGWKEWPVIMMGTANSPLYSPALYDLGKQWIDKVGQNMQRLGHNYERYFLAYYPPHGELRYSTLEADDGRNSFGLYYHSLSFIIESGVYRSIVEDPFFDIAQRTSAYLSIYKQFIQDTTSRTEELEAIEASRSAPVIPYIATNFFWGSDGNFDHTSKAIDLDTGETVEFTAPNFMTKRVVKRYVKTPQAYAIRSSNVDLIKPLLERHEIEYEIVSKKRNMSVETCFLLALENDYDEVYERYEGRQIVRCKPALAREFQEGSLVVNLNALQAKEVIVTIEPQMLYGLFQYKAFAELADSSNEIGVYRVME